MSRAKRVVEPLSKHSNVRVDDKSHEGASTLRIELPFPDRRLSPNARVHWREKATAVAQYREDCGWAAQAGYGDVARYRRGPTLPHLEPPVEATVTFVVPDRRRRDLDNLLAMLKPAWDGLVDAGVLAGDDASQFKVGSVSIEVLRHAPHCRKWDTRSHRGCDCDMGEPKVIVSLRGGGGT